MVVVPEAGNYDLTITATDEGTPALTGSMTLKVIIVKPGMFRCSTCPMKTPIE